MRALHGTTPAAAREIRREGFRLDTSTYADPGDFGRGIYLTQFAPIARTRPVVLVADVALEGALRFASKRDAYAWLRADVWPRLGHTLRGPLADRRAAAERLRREMLKQGRDGIVITDPDIAPDGRAVEVVAYRPGAVRPLGTLFTGARASCGP